MTTLNPGHPIRLHPIRLRPATFHRVPFNRLRHLRGKVGKVRRVIGREPARVLLEIEVAGVVGVCWDFEVREVKASDKTA